jgi:DNA-binding SARP family transcriptional activator
MIRLYLATGQRALAVRQYETCRALLLAELGVEPMEETTALLAQLAPGAPGAAPAGPVVDAATLKQVLDQFNQAMRSFEAARHEVEQAARNIERLVKL